MTAKAYEKVIDRLKEENAVFLAELEHWRSQVTIAAKARQLRIKKAALDEKVDMTQATETFGPVADFQV